MAAGKFVCCRICALYVLDKEGAVVQPYMYVRPALQPKLAPHFASRDFVPRSRLFVDETRECSVVHVMEILCREEEGELLTLGFRGVVWCVVLSCFLYKEGMPSKVAPRLGDRCLEMRCRLKEGYHVVVWKRSLL